MSSAQNLLRTAVVLSNSVFPFSRLNRIPYRLALNTFLRLCRRHPEIRGVYLRHGMAQGSWVPGLSDIDLTVTYAGTLNLREEFLFLTRFWTEQRALRRRFPMLAHVLVLSEDHLPAWGQYGITGYDVRRWKVLYGETPEYTYQEAGMQRDAINDALYRYFECLLAWHFEPLTFLGLRRMQRVASRIFRHAPAGIRTTDDPALLVARVLVGLDKWIRESGIETDFDGSVGEEDCMMLHEDTCLLVPGGRVDEEPLRERLVELRQNPPAGKRMRVATGAVLRYWLRYWSPGQYYDWSYISATLRGTDIIARVEPPSREAFVQSLLNFTGSILTIPQLEKTILQDRAEWFAGGGFLALVERGWFLRLYLEKGIDWPQRARVVREFSRQYPEPTREFAAIQRTASEEKCNLPELRFRAFCLLKETAIAVQPLQIYALHG